MRERFSKTIFTTGRCGLSIRTKRDARGEMAGHDLLPDGESLNESEITPRLLYMLAEAYHAGYKEAVEDGREVVFRLLYESKQPRKPAARIYPSEVMDYREYAVSAGDKHG